MFEYKRKIYFQETDAAGIMFFGNIFGIAHQAYEELMSNCRINIFDNEELIVPIKHCEADFIKPLKIADEFVIRILLKSVSEKTFDLEFSFYNLKNEICAIVRTQHIFVNKQNMKSIKTDDIVLGFIKEMLL